MPARAAVRDLSRRPRFPGGGRRRRGAAAAGGVRGRVPAPAGVLRAAGVQLRATGRRRAGWRGRSCGRSRASCRSSSPRARARRWRRTTCPELLGVEPLRGVGAVRVPRARRASGRCRGTPGGGSPTTTRATCCASCGSRRSRGACSARSGAELVPLRAAGSLLRVRRDVLGPPARGLAGDGRRQARGRRRAGDDRHRRSRVPDAPARARREGRLAGSGRPPGDRARAGRAMPELAQPRGARSARSRAGSSATRTPRRRSTTRPTGCGRTALAAWEGLPDVEELRERAHAIRMARDRRSRRARRAVHARRSRRAAASVFFARTADGGERVRRRRLPRRGREARGEVEVDGDRGDRAERGARGGRACTPVETDLGEYILQLAGEHPVHIVAPAIEKTAEQVAELLCARRGRADPGRARGADERRAAAAARDVPARRRRHHRRELRRLRRPGRSASSRTRATGGSVSSIPRVHVALMGMERLVPTTADLAVLLKLLRAVGHRAEADRLHDAAHRAAPRGRGRTGRRSCTSSSSTTGGRTCCAAGTARCSPASAAAPA